MSNSKTVVYLHGALGKRFGRKIELLIDSPGEAIRALIAMKAGFSEAILKGHFKISKGRYFMQEEELTMPMGKRKSLHVYPVAEASGIELIIIGGIALFAAGVAVTTLFAPKINAPDANAREVASNESFISDGTPNNVEEGHPLPWAFGEVLLGSLVASAGIITTDEANIYNTPYDGDEDGLFGRVWSTASGSFSENVLFGGGGGKGGGSGSSGATEDPNTLTSSAKVNIVDLLGEGEYEGPALPGLQWINFDGTPAENADGSRNFNGLKVTWRAGTVDQTHVAGFTAVEATTELGTEVTREISPIYTVTNPDIDRVRVALRLGGLYQQDTEDGSLKKHSVTMAIDIQSDGGGFTQVGTNKVFSGKTLSTYDREYSVTLPPGRAPWNIRVRRVTGNTESAAIIDDTFIGYATEVIDQKVTMPYTAYVALEVDIKQFGSRIATRSYRLKTRKVEVPSNYDPVTRVYTDVENWDGTFKWAYTNCPPWGLRDILTNDRFGLGHHVTPELVDKWSLYAIARNCDEMIDLPDGTQEPRYTLNCIVRTQEEAYKVLDAVTDMFDGIMFFGAGYISFKQNLPELPQRLVNTANVVEGTLDFQGPDLRDMSSAVVTYWNDIEDNWKLKPEVLEDPELKRLLGPKDLETPAFGSTSKYQSRRHGARILEQQKLGSCTYIAKADHSHIFPGHLVEVQDPRIQGPGVRAGRLKKGSTKTHINLNKEVTLEPGKNYTLKTIIDGAIEIRNVLNSTGKHTRLTCAAFSKAPKGFMIWHLVADTDPKALYRVVRRDETKQGNYKISCIEFDVERQSKIDNVIGPAVVTPEPQFPTGPIKTVSGVNVLEHWRVNGDSYQPAVTVSWSTPGDARVTNYDLQVLRPGTLDWEQVYNGREVAATVVQTDAGDYMFRVKSRTETHLASAWHTSAVIPLTLTEQPLPPVTGLNVLKDNSSLTARLVWNKVSDVRPLEYEVLFSETTLFANATSLGRMSVEETTVRRKGTYFVRTVFLGGFSSEAAYTVVDADLPKVDFSDLLNPPNILTAEEVGQQINVAEETLNEGIDKLRAVLRIVDAEEGGGVASVTLDAAQTDVTAVGLFYDEERVGAAGFPAHVSFQPSNEMTLDGAESTTYIKKTVKRLPTGETVATIAGAFRVNRESTGGIIENRVLLLAYGLEDDYTYPPTGAVAITRVIPVSPDADGWTPFSWTVAMEENPVSGADSYLGSDAQYVQSEVTHLRFGFQLNFNNGDGSTTVKDLTAGTLGVGASQGGSAIADLDEKTALAASRISLVESASSTNTSAVASLTTTTANQALVIDQLTTASGEFSSQLLTIEQTTSGLSSRLTAAEAANSTNAAASQAANSQAATASSVATSALSRSALSAQFGAKSIATNPFFMDYEGALPDGWSVFVGGVVSKVVFSDGSQGARVYTPANVTGGLLQNAVSRPGSISTGKHVLECSFELEAGTLDGSGMLLSVRDAAGAHIAFKVLQFDVEPDASGDIHGSGVVGRQYHFSKTVNVTEANASTYYLYLMGKNYGPVTKPANQIVFKSGILRREASGEAALALSQAVEATVAGKTNVTFSIVGTAGDGKFIIAASADDDGNGNASSNLLVAARTLSLATLNAQGEFDGEVAALSLAGQEAVFTGRFQATRITVGDLSKKVAIEPDYLEASHGDVIGYGGSVSIQPKISFDIMRLPSLPAGERYVAAAVARTATQFTVSVLKYAAGGDSIGRVDTAGGTALTVNKTQAADASNGRYTFRISGILKVLSYEESDDPFREPSSGGGSQGNWFNQGFMTIKTQFNQGSGFVEGPVINVNLEDIGIPWTSSSSRAGNYAYDVTKTVDWGNAIGQHGGEEFKVVLENTTAGSTLTNLLSVAYTTLTGSSSTPVTDPVDITIQHYQS